MIRYSHHTCRIVSTYIHSTTKIVGLIYVNLWAHIPVYVYELKFIVHPHLCEGLFNYTVVSKLGWDSEVWPLRYVTTSQIYTRMDFFFKAKKTYIELHLHAVYIHYLTLGTRVQWGQYLIFFYQSVAIDEFMNISAYASRLGHTCGECIRAGIPINRYFEQGY